MNPLNRKLLDCIGNTPLVRLELGAAPGAAYAKLELMNPFGMKDRVAKQAILEARRKGLLRAGAPVVESSSGTMALGVAVVALALGHPVHIVSDPKGMDPITTAKLQAMGCHLHVVERPVPGSGWQGARLERLQEIMAEHPDAFWPRQYDNPDNPAAYTALARELIKDLDRVDILVGPVGSGGSLCGTARELRRTWPHLHVIAVDAVGSVIFGQPDSDRRQRGLGNSLVPPNVDKSEIDEVHWLNDREAFTATWDLAREQRIFAGNSSGSCYAVLRHLARESWAGARIVGIFPDRGDRYVGTVYSPEYWRQHGIDAQPLSAAPREVPYGTRVTEWSYAHLPR